MDERSLDLFSSGPEPNSEATWQLYEDGLGFNAQIQLDENVRLNENFYIGKQWEGVESNGLPTPQINIIKRVVGFIVATITSDNIHVNARALSNTVGTSGYKDLVQIVNNEYEAIIERNCIPALVRKMTRNAAVDADGCIYTYWDSKAETGQVAKGQIASEIIENTRVLFGDPNDNNVQSQPWIIIARRETVRSAKLRSKRNGVSDWYHITADEELSNAVDAAKHTDNKVTVLQIFWKDDDTGEVWSYETTQTTTIKKPWNMKIRLYPITWLNWDYVQDSYHGQAMVTGLVPNQVFINKAWAMTMLSIMKSAFGKVIYDATKIRRWDNRVGGAIPVQGGVENVAQIIDPPPVSPQVSQYIQLAVEQTEQSLGATSVALGDTRPDNTSAIIALQRAAATPSEMTKQNIHDCLEELFRIYLEFMAHYYGKRYVDGKPTTAEIEAVKFAQQMNPDLEIPESVPVLFDFGILKDHPLLLKLDVGASTYYSEIAAVQTLTNLLTGGFITIVDFLERVSDDYIPDRLGLLEAKRREMQMQKQALGLESPPPGPGSTGNAPQNTPDVTGGRGYGAIQRAINKTGEIPRNE